MSGVQTESEQKKKVSKRIHFSFRLNVFFLITFLLFSSLIVKLAILQFVEAPKLRAQESKITTANDPLPPIRGNIYDSKGQPIAYSESTQSLYYTLRSGVSEKEGEKLAGEIVKIVDLYGNPALKKLTAAKVFENMDFGGRVHDPFQQRRLKTGLTEREIAYFSEHRDQFPGIEIVEESVRKYAADRVAVQLVGYMNKMKGAKENLDFYKQISKNQNDDDHKYLDNEDVGYDGIELMYQEQLRGLNGHNSYSIDRRSHIISKLGLTKPVKGSNLFLTIDRNVQHTAEQAILDQIATTRASTARTLKDAQPTTGYAVAIEVDTGNVVAMASMPDYDSNIWLGGINQAELDAISPYMGNGAVREVFPPYKDPKERSQHPTSLVFLGSTQKPLSILTGLMENLITPDTKWNDPGYFPFGSKGHETEVQNAGREPHGLITPTEAIAKSSNAFMAANIGNKLFTRDRKKGVDVWDGHMKEFGLGVKTGSGLPKESPGIVDYYKTIENSSAQSALILASFGQQGKYTALQLGQYVATLASHGKRMKPQFVERMTDSEGQEVWRVKPEVLNEVKLPDVYWKTIENGMKQVPVQGFENANYTFMRKTGTSQQDVGRRKAVENAVFIAYAPADKPKLAVAVVVPDGGYGGWGAAPIARKIFDAYDAEIGLTSAGPRPPASAVAPTPGTAVQP